MIGGRALPASSAAMRPTAPAFAVCVWRIAGRSRRISRARRMTARASRSGAISRCSSSIVSIRTPRRSATDCIDASPRAKVPATRIVSNPRSARPAVRYATCSAGPPTFSRAITRRTFTRSGSATQELDRAAEPLLEADLRPVAEQSLRLAEVGPRVADVSRARGEVPLPHRLAEDLADRLGHLIHAPWRPGRDVDDLAPHPLCLCGAARRVDDVATIREIAW